MKTAVLVVAVGVQDILNVSKPTFEKYCKKTNSDLVIITQPKYNINSRFNNRFMYPRIGTYNYLKFEKNQIYDLFESYDKVLRLDADIVISPHAPNYFDLDSNFIYVTEEPGRSTEIKKVQSSLGVVKSWDNFYFNGGVVLASKKHKNAFDISDINFDKDLGILKEQNVLNWKVNKLNLPVHNLGTLFNFFKGAFVNGSSYNDFDNDNLRRSAHFIHHTVQGTEEKINSMLKDINFFYNQTKVFI